ncbi:MAG: flagellar hook-length control protein FliK [Pseudomonadota bacterium]
MIMPSAEKSVVASAVGTVPAFADSMLKSDTRTSDQSLSEEAATDGNSRGQVTDLDIQTPETYPMGREGKPFSAPIAPEIVLYPKFAPERLPVSDPRETDIPKLPSADDGAVKLADIDPQSPIMPYRTAGTGGTAIPAITDSTGAPDQRGENAGDAKIVPPMQKPDASGPKTLPRVDSTPLADDETAATARSEQLPASNTGTERPVVSGLQTLTVPQRMPADTGSRQIIEPVTDAEPSTDHVSTENLAPPLELKKLLNPSPQMENAKQSLPLPAAANSKPEKLGDDMKPAEVFDPEVAEIKNSASNAAQAPPVNPLAGLRLRQSPIAETASGLQVDAMRALSPSSNSAKAADAMARASTLPADAVLEFDSAFIANLTREISLIANSKGTARFSLKPEHLGRIDVEIRGGERGDDIKLVAETESVKQFLIQSQSRLEQEIRLHGQKLTSLDIGTGLDQGPERQASESQQAENFRTRTNGSSDEEQAEPQYYVGTASGQTTGGARYA